MHGRQLRRQIRRTTIISFGAAAFLAGIGLARLGWFVPGTILLAGLPLLVLCSRRLLVLSVPAIMILGLMLGLWRGGLVDQQIRQYDGLIGRKVMVTGVVAEDSTYGAKKQIDFRLGDVTVDDRKLPGQVRVTSFDPVEPKRGDVVSASGKLYAGFGNYQAAVYFGKVQVVSSSNSWLDALRRQFSAAIRNVVPEPQASLGLGFLLGIKSQLPDTLNDQLKLVGLTHIVVASGYNLTILVRAARRLFARRSKYQATLAAVLLMVSFVGVTGLTPSMSRAALVTSLSLYAWYYGRVIHPVLLLLFAAAVTAAVNPLYVWGDVGWYLSFLAFGGVMLGAPLLQKWIFGKRRVPQLVQIGLETLCAELAALPLTLFVFGSISVIGLLANMLVVPLIPLTMLVTFVAGVGVVLLPGPGAWLALPAHWMLGYVTTVVDYLANIPWARMPLSLSAVGMVAVYAVLVGVGILLWRKTKLNYLGTNLVE